MLASIKAVGEDHAIVQYQGKEVEVNLSPEEAKKFHQYVVHQENILVPMNIKTQKLFVDLEEPWYEQELEELKGISYQEELGSAKGVSYTLTKEVALNPPNSERQNVKTLIHELAHAKLHTKDTHLNYTAAEKEFQAEMTAYTVSSYFGIDTTSYSLDYLSHWTKGKTFEDKTKLLKEVHETSVGFIETIEDILVKEREKNQSPEKKQ